MTAVGSFTMLIDGEHAFGSKPPSVGDDPGLALILPIAAGLLCGFGSQLGSGCTSGHGVCGLPRFSLRSLVATCTFMATGAATSMTVGAIATGATAGSRPPSEAIPLTNTWLLVLAVCVVAVGAIIAYRCPFCNECLSGDAAGGAAGESAPLSSDPAKPACSSGACSLSSAPSSASPSSCFSLLHPINVLRSSLVTGAIFGIGLALSGMCNPYKVKDFLDPVHGWDPSLAFVMGGAVAVNVVTFRFVLARPNPLFDSKFFVPTRNDITWELVVGSAIFGMGWGLAGYCPAPAFVSLSTGNVPVIAWVSALVLGMGLYQLFMKLLRRWAPQIISGSGCVRNEASGSGIAPVVSTPPTAEGDQKEIV
ncbi:hypothetical protein CLOM_g14306 [Closterium sp. NIES-68]|nr:hypothetical protein CLOM_g14306 [Closterium sp. NIES-68]GJP61712.1 hypothetical protein CLOP_g18854 [Closterium sp. NIES-67]